LTPPRSKLRGMRSHCLFIPGIEKTTTTESILDRINRIKLIFPLCGFAVQTKDKPPVRFAHSRRQDRKEKHYHLSAPLRPSPLLYPIFSILFPVFQFILFPLSTFLSPLSHLLYPASPTSVKNVDEAPLFFTNL